MKALFVVGSGIVFSDTVPKYSYTITDGTTLISIVVLCDTFKVGTTIEYPDSLITQ